VTPPLKSVEYYREPVLPSTFVTVASFGADVFASMVKKNQLKFGDFKCFYLIRLSLGG
jgi:hypothetical protein